MAKVILSRKGYDSTYGGGSSPIMPNGDLISIPIPANDKEEGIPYAEIRYGDKSYLQLMEELGMKIPENKICHFDPDLIRGAYNRAEKWNGIFGQQGAALSHLQNQEVEKGDIFLFFGSFKRTWLSDKLRYEKDHERHIIFGYLVIGEIIEIEDESSVIYKDHPHYVNKEVYKPQNTVYIANNDNDFGAFKYREELVLTKNGYLKSVWELPMIFHPLNGTNMSRHTEKAFEKRDGTLLFQSQGIGQDFVMSGNIEIEKWAREIIAKSDKITPGR